MCFDKETSTVYSKEGYRILCIDRHSSHITNAAIRFCIEKKIILLCLLSHTTHLLQPLDLKIFAPLANVYRCAIANRCHLGATYQIDKVLFLELFQEAREQAITSDNIKSAWAAAGLKLFNPAIVLDKLPKSPNPIQEPATPNTKIRSDPKLLLTPANIDKVKALIYYTIQENTWDTAEILIKMGKAACRAFADAYIQQSTNSALMAAAKSKYQKRTREHYRQARVMNMEVVREREAKNAEKAMNLAWHQLLKLTPDLFQESSKIQPVKSRISGTGNPRAFVTAAKPFLQLSPGIFSKCQFSPTKSIRSQCSPNKIYAKSPTKSKTRLAVSRSVLPKSKGKKVAIEEENTLAPEPTFTRSGRLRKEKVHWEQA